jgi:hypothetical protein
MAKCKACEGTGWKRTYSQTRPDPIKCPACRGTGNKLAPDLVPVLNDLDRIIDEHDAENRRWLEANKYEELD